MPQLIPERDVATAIADVESLLGVGVKDAGSLLAVADKVEAGLSASAVDHIAEALAPDDAAFKYRIVPKATLERRRKSRSRLTKEEGDRVARLGKVYEMAISIYRDPARMREFLSRPHSMLENRAPIDVALATGAGADAVVNLLGRAAYGGGV
jgi:putative toxin-antitoxin system antitoxin component (TIGR02293 family)